MASDRFETRFDDLPGSLAIFPLTGVLLLPRGRLPLNIFEPRYLAMIEDALRTPHRLIGMIQPREAPRDAEAPPVYDVGCAGRIISFSETEDGRLLVTLKGVARFRVAEELSTLRGYRMVRPQWQAYQADCGKCEHPAPETRQALEDRLRAYFDMTGLSVDWDAVAETSCDRLVTSIAMACPFDASEKQALLEAPTLTARMDVMRALVEIAIANQDRESGGPRH